MKGLFADSMVTWLKIKQESARYPSWTTTPEDKARHVIQHKEREGITLDPSHHHTHAQQFLGHIQGKPPQTHYRSSPRLPSHCFGLQSLQQHTPSENCQQRHSRGRLCQLQGQSTRQQRCQHLCGRSHHVMQDSNYMSIWNDFNKEYSTSTLTCHLHNKPGQLDIPLRPPRGYYQQTG